MSGIGGGSLGLGPEAAFAPVGPPAPPGAPGPLGAPGPSNAFVKTHWKTIAGIVAALIATIVVVAVVIKVRSGMRKKQAESDADDADDDMPVVGRPPVLGRIPAQGAAPSHGPQGPAAASHIPLESRYPKPGERQPSIRSEPRQMPLGGVDASQAGPRNQGPLSFQSRPNPYEGSEGSAGYSGSATPAAHTNAPTTHAPHNDQQLSPMEMAEMAALQAAPQDVPASSVNPDQSLDQFHAQPPVSSPPPSNAGFTPI